MSEINIKINGEAIKLQNISSVEELINARNIIGTMFVIERNLKIVLKEKYSETLIKEGDSIEIVGFFGGG